MKKIVVSCMSMFSLNTEKGEWQSSFTTMLCITFDNSRENETDNSFVFYKIPSCLIATVRNILMDLNLYVVWVQNALILQG